MESIRDLSDDELLKPLFSAKENIADAVSLAQKKLYFD